MATTTNYGWTTPDDTDLVKNGADAIRTLGSSIDTSMNAALGTKKAGMVLLNTTSFSAVASQSVNNVFSASYDNYFVTVDGTLSASEIMNLRMRVGGVDNSTASSYSRSMLQAASASASAFSETESSFRNAVRGTTNMLFGNIYIYRPFLASQTFFQNNAGDGTTVTNIQTGRHNQATSYDGFSLIIPGAGVTATGTIRVYGLNQ
jgi:hypothetical protein